MAIFDIKAGVFYKGLWRAAFPYGDFMAICFLEADVWYFRYRFRYFVDKKVWGSEDKRSAYQMKKPDGPGVKETVFTQCHQVLNDMTTHGFITDLEYFPCDGDHQAMAALLTSGIPGIHYKVMNQEQFEEYQRTNIPPSGT